VDRRRFLGTGAAAAAGLVLSSGAAFPVGKSGKRVVVLGAGLAGLTAAWELDQAGHEVVVVEAQARPGGRVRTLREGFSPGLSAEAGAMSFSDSYQHLLHYVRLFQVPYASLATAAVRSASISTLYHLRGKRLRLPPGGTVDWPFDLTAEERALGPGGILGKYLLPVLDAADAPAPPAALPDWVRPYDRKTLLQLAGERGASRGARELIRTTAWFADARDGESAAATLLSDLSLFYRGQTAYGFPGGSDALPLAFASRLRGQLQYGTEVVRIEHGGERVQIVVRSRDRLDRLTADRVVCALPFSVLRRVEVSPPFSASKDEVVSGLEYRPVTRVYLQVRRRFWASEGVSGGAMTDLPIGQVQEHPILPIGTEGERALLEAHARGDAAVALDAMSEDQRLRFVLAEMEKVHPHVGEYFEAGQSKSWQDDPWARGAYTSFRPGQMAAWLPASARPEGRIHFAGEHTSVFPATMEGAIASGVRAAREIDEA